MSGTADAAVGMMDSAYFTGRRELLEFFNDLLSLNLAKIEQTASGAVACQLTEYIFPGSIPMSRVNWEARSDYEFIQNYKLLQVAFTKNRVQRHVDVDRLIRAKYQDNLEFCQWLKAFYEQSGVYRPEYDAIAVRMKGKGGKKWNSKTPRSYKGNATKKPTTTTTIKPSSPASRSARPLRERVPVEKNKPEVITKEVVVVDEKMKKENEDLSNKNSELNSKVSELELAIVEIEKERDFYFDKLRNVEVILQVYQEKVGDQEKSDESANEFDAVVDKVFKVLYATAEDGITVSDDGEVMAAGADTLTSDSLDPSTFDEQEIENLELE